MIIIWVIYRLRYHLLILIIIDGMMMMMMMIIIMMGIEMRVIRLEH